MWVCLCVGAQQEIVKLKMENDDAYFICDAAFGDGIFNGEPGVLAGFRCVFAAGAGFFV